MKSCREWESSLHSRYNLCVCVCVQYLFSKFIIFPLSAFLCWRYTIYTIHHDSRPCMYIHVLIFYFVLCVAMEEHKIEKKKIYRYFLNGREEKTSALLGHTHTQHFFFCLLEGGHFKTSLAFKCLIYFLFFFSISSQGFFVILFSLRLPQQQKKRYLTHPDEHWPDMDRCTCFNCWWMG